MDVLDHSCSKLGFGGKMCIDGTFKFEEERSDDYSFEEKASMTFEHLKDNIPGVHAINGTLVKKGIPCLIVSVHKTQKNQVRDIHTALTNFKEAEAVKIILYVEHTVDANDLPTALWRLCNNLDPKRDHHLIQRESINKPGHSFACMGFDGTRKTKEFDNFHRDWPNIIVADEATIEAVDNKWAELGLGAFLSSPSLKFKDQMYGDEAVVGI
jgi:4-hydroxy-3-polyprenylbenzoate decarboxylase